MRSIQLKFGLFMVLACTNLQAVEDKKQPKGFFGAAEFGTVVTSGNTKNSTTTGKFELSYDSEKWLHYFKLDIITAETDGDTTAERYLLNLKSDYKLENNAFLFMAFSYDVDKFSGFDSQSTISLGYGKNIYDTKKFKLSAEIGPGYRVNELEMGGDESETVLHFAVRSKYVLNEASHLGANLNVDSGTDQTISILDVGYINKLSKTLALKVGFNYKHSSEVPVANKKTDTITSISLLYSF